MSHIPQPLLLTELRAVAPSFRKAREAEAEPGLSFPTTAELGLHPELPVSSSIQGPVLTARVPRNFPKVSCGCTPSGTGTGGDSRPEPEEGAGLGHPISLAQQEMKTPQRLPEPGRAGRGTPTPGRLRDSGSVAQEPRLRFSSGRSREAGRRQCAVPAEPTGPEDSRGPPGQQRLAGALAGVFRLGKAAKTVTTPVCGTQSRPRRPAANRNGLPPEWNWPIKFLRGGGGPRSS